MKLYHSTLEDYAKYSHTIREDLSSVHRILCGLCDIGLQSRLEAEPEYQDMEKKNRYNAMKLYELVKKNCNGSTVVVVDDVIGNLIEGLYNFVLMCGKEYDALPRYLQAFEHKYEVLSGASFNMANAVARDLHIEELVNRNQTNGKVYKSLLGWKNAAVGSSGKEDIK